MKISAFGQLCIDITPTSIDPEILNVDIGAETRKETMSMTTNKDETIDQFCQRMKSMLRALANAEPRIVDDEKVVPDKKKKERTWPEQKAELKQ